MIVPDINLLVYAYNSSAPEHPAARRWWEGLLSGTTAIGLPWVVALGYVRIMTHRRVVQDPLEPREAIAHLRSWLERPQVAPLHPGPRHVNLLDDLMTASASSGAMTTDAHLAALAIEHQAELHSNDTDFSRFAGLRWVNPIG